MLRGLLAPTELKIEKIDSDSGNWELFHFDSPQWYVLVG